MISRRTLTLLMAAAPAASASGLFQERTAVAFISDPSGPHLQIYLNTLRLDTFWAIAIADATGGIFERAAKTLAPRKCRTFRDVEEMLRTVRPQLVLVALEARLAPEAIRLALEHDAHVLAEKPACVRASDFAALVDLAEKQKRHLMLAFATRLDSGFTARTCADHGQQHRAAARGDSSLHRRSDAAYPAGVPALMVCVT